MGLYKRGKTWRMSFTVDGKQRHRSTGHTHKNKAEDVWSKVRSSIIDGTYRATPPRRSPLTCPTFEIAVENYLEHREDHGKSTRNYARLAGKWTQAFKGRRLDSITPEEIATKLREWNAEHGWSNAALESG